MQYYRLWIYSCNVVLGLTSAIFIIFAAFVVADVRLSLLEGVELYHPTFFYAYGALIVQCGVVQTIGCLGAQRLSHKLLSLYWTLLLLLTLGDIGVGLYWVFHLERVKINLRPYLSKEFIEKYSTDETFTLRWNKIQSQDRCCGVDGPFDFEKFTSSQLHHSKHSAFTANSHVVVDVESGLLSLPKSCCTLLYVPTTVSSSSSRGTGLDKAYRVPHYPPEEEHPPYNDQSPGSTTSGASYSTANDDSLLHPNDYAEGGGGLRRGRTVTNFPHKNDEPHHDHPFQPRKGIGAHLLHEKNQEAEYANGFDEEERKGIDTDYYVDYPQDSPDNFNNYKKSHEDKVTGVVAVPDHTSGDNHEIKKPAGPNQTNSSAVEKRDIKSYDPIHSHKVRHELHRKLHPSPLSPSLIDSNTTKNSTNASLALAKITSGGTDGLLEILKSSTTHKNHERNQTTKENQNVGATHERKKELHHDHHHNSQKIHNFNLTNKLFPSNAFHIEENRRRRSKRRETRRALLRSSTPVTTVVTQVPANFPGSRVSPATSDSRKNLVCQEQPEGLNHHNSNKKDLLDQRKTRRRREDNHVAGAGSGLERKYFLHYETRKKTTTDSPRTYKFTSVEIMSRKEEDGIGRMTKKENASLMAKLSREKSERRSRFSKEKPMYTHSSSDLTSFPSLRSRSVFNENEISSTGTEDKGELSRRKNLGKRDADQEGLHKESHDALVQSRAARMGSLQRLPITSPLSSVSSPNDLFEVGKNRKIEVDNLEKSYFFPVSSFLSSTTYLEANSPSMISASSALLKYGDDSWDGDGKVNGSSNDTNNNGNASSSSSTEGQKRLYVYGVGCGVKLIEWVDRVSGIMFILGFCIIGFAKTCFLVILRTEIREMIEKINMIEPEGAMSPAITQKSGSLAGDQPRFHYVSHPLLQNPHRASTVSAQGVLLPTIKSPDGPATTSFITGGGFGGLGGGGYGLYNRPNRHYLRRASNVVGGDRSRSHSNETVNMTCLMTAQGESGVGREKGRSNPNLSSAGGSSGTIAHLEEKDPVSGLSITVPSSTSSSYVYPSSVAASAAVRYLRRSSTCSSSTNPTSIPYQFGFDGEPRPGPSSRFYQYFEPVYQPTHLYQQHHHHHYMRNRTHSRNMSCGAILPLATYRTNSAAAAASAALAYNRGARVNTATLSSATTTTTSNMPASTGCSFSSTSKDETEMVISVSLEHIASSDQDEEREDQTDERTTAPEIEEDEKEQQKKDWAAATQCLDKTLDRVRSSAAQRRISEEDESLGTKLQTFHINEESENESITEVNDGMGDSGGNGERELQRRNGNNNVDLANSLPMSYIGTAV